MLYKHKRTKKLASVQTTQEKFGLVFFTIPNVCTLLQASSDVKDSSKSWSSLLCNKAIQNIPNY